MTTTDPSQELSTLVKDFQDEARVQKQFRDECLEILRNETDGIRPTLTQLLLLLRKLEIKGTKEDHIIGQIEKEMETLEKRNQDLDKPIEEIFTIVHNLKDYIEKFTALLLNPGDEDAILNRQICINTLRQQLDFEISGEMIANYKNNIDDYVERSSGELKRISTPLDGPDTTDIEEDRELMIELIRSLYTYVTNLELHMTLNPSLTEEQIFEDNPEQKIKAKVKDLFVKAQGLVISTSDNGPTKWDFRMNPLAYLRDYVGMTFPRNDRGKLLKRIYVDIDFLERRWIELWVVFKKPQKMIIADPESNSEIPKVIAMKISEGIDAMIQPRPGSSPEGEKPNKKSGIIPFSEEFFEIFVHPETGPCMKNTSKQLDCREIDEYIINILVQMEYGKDSEEVKKNLKGRPWAKQILPIIGNEHRFPKLAEDCYVIVRFPFPDVDNDPYGLYKFADFEEGILLTPCT